MRGMHFKPADSLRGNATKIARAKKAPAASTWTMERSIADRFDARRFANMEVALEGRVRASDHDKKSTKRVVI